MSEYSSGRECYGSSSGGSRSSSGSSGSSGSSSSSSNSSNHRSSDSERAAILEEIFRDEPATMPRPAREIQTNAIRQYHNHALSTRTSEHTAEVRRHRERRQAEQQPSYESLRGDVSTSESDESSPSSPRRKTYRSKEHTNPKYLVRGFLKSIFRSRSSPSSKAKEDDRQQRFSDHESFFPSPMITFMIDQPKNLVCQICQSTPLKMGISTEEAKNTTPAILPCGHVACQSCLGLWLKSNGNCPFCRLDMVYAGCGHNVEPRLIAHDTIHSIPRTVADGGRVGHSCHTCRAKAQREATLWKWLGLAEDFKAARQEAEKLGTEEAIQAMKKAQRAFERVPFDDSYGTLALSIRTW